MYLFASYDYAGAKGYILYGGNYYISIGGEAHEALNNVLAAKGTSGIVDVLGAPASGNAKKTFAWTEELDAMKYSKSAETGVVFTNQFDDCDINNW